MGIKKTIIELSMNNLLIKKIFRKNKRYLCVDERTINSLEEFRNFQRFLEKSIILSRHKNIKIKGALVIEKFA